MQVTSVRKMCSIWILGSVRKKEGTDLVRLGHFQICVKAALLLQPGKNVEGGWQKSLKSVLTQRI